MDPEEIREIIEKVEEHKNCLAGESVQTQFEEQLEEMLLNGGDCHTTIHEESEKLLQELRRKNAIRKQRHPHNPPEKELLWDNSFRGCCLDAEKVIKEMLKDIPVIRGSSKQGSSGLCEPIKPVKVMKLEELDKETVTGSHTEAQILAGVATEKPGSFEDVEKQIKILEKNMSAMLEAIQSLKMEVGWLKKLSTMKW